MSVFLVLLAIVSLLALAQLWSVGVPRRWSSAGSASADHPDHHVVHLRIA